MRTSRGVLYMMLATWSFTFVGLGVKLLRHIDSLQVNFFKALVCMLVCYGVARYKQISIWGEQPLSITTSTGYCRSCSHDFVFYHLPVYTIGYC